MGVAIGRADVRRRIGGLAGLALLVAVGVGIGVAAFEIAGRTERAYPAYLERAEVADVVVNPGLATERVEEIIAAAPGVESYASHDFLIATLDDGAPRTQAEVDSDEDGAQVWMSSDGRFTEQDRPVVHRGRMVESGLEAFVGHEVAQALDLEVGDQLPLAYWAPSFLTPGVGPQPEDEVEALGSTTVEVVGIGTFPDEVLVDELYPRFRVLVAPEAAQPYSCTQTLPEVDDPRPLAELVYAMFPPDCALAYRYFALHLDDGDAGVGRVTDHLQVEFERENEELPPRARAEDVGYVVIPTATRDQRERVERSLAPAVGSLRLFGLVAAGSIVIVVVLLVLHMQRRAEGEAVIWRHLGMTTGQRLVAATAPVAVAIVAGVVGAGLVGWLGSGVGPVASAANVDPHAGPALTIGVALPLLAGSLIVLLIGAALGAFAVVRAGGTRRPARRSPFAPAVRAAAPSRALGMRAATNSTGAGAVLVGSSAAVGVVLASLVFSTSLSGLVDEPARYGWPYDAAVMVGFGYGGADEDAIARTLEHPDVERWGIANLGSVTIDGENIAGVAGRQGFASIPLPVADGRLPAGADEVAVGIQSADDLGLDVGDEVEIGNYLGQRSATVTGTVVLPPVGPFESDRAATGTGVLLSEELFNTLVADGEEAFGLQPGALEETGLGAFVVIDLRDGVDSTAFLASIDEDLVTWDRVGLRPLPLPEAVRPAAIADVESMRRVPVALGVVFAATMAGALAIGIAVATRGRRRELALLRALGSSGRELAASVRWHALAVVLVALLVGGPLGIAAGRSLYRLFALDLGVVPVVVTSIPWILVVVAVTAAVGMLAAAGPGRAAARDHAATALRNE